ncbi:hypothetical protein [Capnocytophaga haemolytica]|jgi:hypothetical protein
MKNIAIQSELLPTLYLSYIENTDRKEVQLVRYNTFTLYTLEELFEEISVDGRKNIALYLVREYAQTMQEVGVAFEEGEQELLAHSLTIGYDNTEALFIDEREVDSPLYVYYPDGGDIEKKKKRVSQLK